MPFLAAVIATLVAILGAALIVVFLGECEVRKHNAARQSRHRIIRARRNLRS